MAQDLSLGAGMKLFGLCKIIIHQNVIGVPKRTAFHVAKRSTHLLEALEINAIDHFHSSRRAELCNHRRNGSDMRKVSNFIRYLDGNRRTRD